HRGRDSGRERPPRLRAHAPDAGAAHPPGAGHVEHLHEPRAERAGRDGLSRGRGPRRAAARGGDLAARRALRVRTDHRARRFRAALPRRPVLQGVRGADPAARAGAGGPCAPARNPGRDTARPLRRPARGRRWSLDRRHGETEQSGDRSPGRSARRLIPRRTRKEIDMARIIWHGHSCFTLITDDGVRIMFDPWLDENPAADITTDDVEALDYILVSHGHFDHFADAIGLAKKTGATLVSSYEIVSYAESQGVRRGHGMSIGGGYRFPFGYVKMTPALHGPGVAGDEGPFAAMPGGWWLDMNGKRLYHAGDTALIMEMQLLAGKVDVALLPIGDNYTM